MRQIALDVDVYAMLWAERRPPESDENEIIGRVLREIVDLRSLIQEDNGDQTSEHVSLPSMHENDSAKSPADRPVVDRITQGTNIQGGGPAFGKMRWVDDVRTALVMLGGEADLEGIYRRVKDIRVSGGRSTPRTLDATVRRTIEDHSSDSENFRSNGDFFAKVSRGRWALRD